jgi:hypothetical protein
MKRLREEILPKEKISCVWCERIAQGETYKKEYFEPHRKNAERYY